MSYFNSNITGSSGGSGGASGLVTKFVKTITISSSKLAKVTINISSDISNYKDITNDRIIVELNDVSAIAAGDAKLTHTYNAETGIITIASTNSSIPFASSSAVELSVNVYVAGAVQIPPTTKVTGVASVIDIGTSLSLAGISNYLPRDISNYEFTMIPLGYLNNNVGSTSVLDTTISVVNNVLKAEPVNLRFTRTGSADSHYVNMMYKAYSKNYDILKAGASSEVDVSVQINNIDNFDIGKVILRINNCVSISASGSAFNNTKMFPTVSGGVLTVPAIRYAARSDEGARYIFNYDILYVKGD